VKKLLPLFMVLLLLSACAQGISSQTVTPSPTPAPTPVSTPAAVVEGAEPDLLIVHDGEFSGVYASTGEVVYPCEYRYLQSVSSDRVALGRYVPNEDNNYVTSVVAIGDLSGNLLTDFSFRYVEYDGADCGLLYAIYDKDTQKAAILDAKTCQPLLELPSTFNFLGASKAAGTFLLLDYETNTASLHAIAKLRQGSPEPLAELENVAYLRCYDAATGVGLLMLNDGKAAFFGGDGSFETVYVDRVHDEYFGGEGPVPFMKDGRWGYADFTGSAVISPRFDFATPFSNGLAAVLQGGAYGYIDQTGRMVIEPQFAEAGGFAGGVALVKNASGEGFLIDKSGNTVLAGVQYCYALGAEADMAQVEGVQQEDGGRQYWVAANGKLTEVSLGQSTYISSERMQDGLCAISGYDEQTGAVLAALLDTRTGSYIAKPGEYSFFTGAQSPLNSKKPRADCFLGYRYARNVLLCDLFDASGNRILVGLNDVYCVGEAVAAVRKGFSWGIMDFRGQWICSYSIFNTLKRD